MTDLVDQLEEVGYVVRRAMVPPDELAFLRETHARLFAARAELVVETDETGVPFLERLRDASERVPALLETIFWKEGCEAAARVLEGDRMLAELMLLSKPAGAAPSPLHQPAATPHPRVVRSVTLWMPLDDCEGDDGCLLVVPGSHLRVVHHDLAGRLAGPLPAPDRLPLAAGDAVLLHEALVHGAEGNASDHPRAALQLVAWTPTALAA